MASSERLLGCLTAAAARPWVALFTWLLCAAVATAGMGSRGPPPPAGVLQRLRWPQLAEPPLGGSSCGRWSALPQHWYRLNGSSFTATVLWLTSNESEQYNKQYPVGRDHGFEVWRVIQQMLNVKLHFVAASEGGVGDGGGAGLGLLGQLRGGRADVSLTALAPTKLRRRSARFTKLGLSTRCRLFARQPHPGAWLGGAGQLFCGAAWAALGGAAALLAAALWAAAHSWRPADAAFAVCYLVASQGLPQFGDQGLQRVSWRVAALWSLLCCYLVSQFYSSQLVALVTASRPRLPFQSLEEVAAQSEYAVYMYADYAVTKYAQAAESGPMRELWRRHLEGRPGQLLATSDHWATLRLLCARRAVLFAPDAIVRVAWSRAPCPLTLLPPSYFSVGTAYPTRRGFPYLHHVDYALLRMRETGVSQNLLQHFLPPLKPRPLEEEGGEQGAAGAQQAALVFAGAAVALTVLVAEWLSRRLACGHPWALLVSGSTRRLSAPVLRPSPRSRSTSSWALHHQKYTEYQPYQKRRRHFE